MQRLGVSLIDVIQRNRLRFSYKQIVALGCKLITAIENFHDMGYIHCDIKPDNIMFGLKRRKKNKKLGK